MVYAIHNIIIIIASGSAILSFIFFVQSVKLANLSWSFDPLVLFTCLFVIMYMYQC